jgi:hypothetical protein
MATQNSDLVANLEATPSVANATQELGGRVRVAQGTVAVAADGSGTGDIIMLAPIPTNASITSIKLASDDLDSNGSPALLWDVGLYDTSGTAKDADFYATDITLGQAATAFTEYRFEAANINTCGQKVWEDAGDSAQPEAATYYLAMTVSTAAATGAAGDVSFIVEYVVD